VINRLEFMDDRRHMPFSRTNESLLAKMPVGADKLQKENSRKK